MSTLQIGGENISEPKYEINNPIIHKIGFNPFSEILSIQFSSGTLKTLHCSLEDYKEFINSENLDDYYYEKIHDTLLNQNAEIYKNRGLSTSGSRIRR